MNVGRKYRLNFESFLVEFRILLSVVAALSCWGYMLGFLWSISIKDGIVRYLILMFLQLLLQPVFAILEILGVAYAIWSPPIDGFHIVQKEKGAQLHATQNDPTLAAAARAAFEQSGEKATFEEQAAMATGVTPCENSGEP